MLSGTEFFLTELFQCMLHSEQCPLLLAISAQAVISFRCHSLAQISSYLEGYPWLNAVYLIYRIHLEIWIAKLLGGISGNHIRVVQGQQKLCQSLDFSKALQRRLSTSFSTTLADLPDLATLAITFPIAALLSEMPA